MRWDEGLVFVWTQPDVFTQHMTQQFDDDATICGIVLSMLPFEDEADPKEPRPANDGDRSRTWYGDHDRDDVVACSVCRAGLPPIVQILFDLKVLVARIYDTLTLTQRDETWEILNRYREV